MLFTNNLVFNKIFAIICVVFIIVCDNCFAITNITTNSAFNCKDEIFETNNYLDFNILKQKIDSLNLDKVTKIVVNIEININITETSKVKLLNYLRDIQKTLKPITNYVIEGFSSDNVEEFIVKAYNCRVIK